MNNQDLILIIDDDESILEMLKLMFIVLGYKILIASNGEEAINLFNKYKNEIHFILSDMKMQPTDGWEVLQELRNISPNIPFIMYSGFEKDDVINKYPQQPTSFLTKTDLIKKLKEYLIKNNNI